MASGNLLVSWNPICNEPPSASYATLAYRNAHPILEFDATSAESCIFSGFLPQHYSGNGITASVCWVAATGTSGSVVFSVAFERLNSGFALTSDSFATAINSSASNAPGSVGTVAYATATLTNSEIDGLVAGEAFRVKIARVPSDGGDTMIGDAQLVNLSLKET